MLHDASSPTHRKQLCAVVAEVALLAGQLAVDMNDYTVALGHYRDAINAATEAEDTALQAGALTRISLTYSEQGDIRAAMLLLARADVTAQQSGKRALQAWIKAIEAEAHATRRDDTACKHALEDAETILADPGTEEAPYWTAFSAARLAGYRGICSVRLGEPEAALVAMQDSLQQAGSSVRRRPRVLTDMATAHIQLGAIEQACDLASEALVLTKQTQNRMMIPRLRKFRRALDPWQDTQAVRQFDEQFLLA
jgi:tetratricopeptide (TPR) repeat protein